MTEHERQIQIEQRRQEEIRAAYAVLGRPDRPEMQLVLADLVTHFRGNPFVEGKPDVTAYRCGELAVIDYILARIEEARQTSEVVEEKHDGTSASESGQTGQD